MIKQARLDHEQNVRLQGLAKQARETAEMQKQIAQNVSQELQRIVEDSHLTFKKLDDILVRYEQLESEDPTLNYKELRDATNHLIVETKDQKTILDKSSKEINELIKKVKDFKIPDEKDSEDENQEIKNSLKNLNSKVF